MRVIILGASGLIGHKLLQNLAPDLEAFGTTRQNKEHYSKQPLLLGDNVIYDVDAYNFDHLTGVINAVNPNVILNCIGITKRKIDEHAPLAPIKINAAFPHKLANWAKINNKRVIHFSTDCVFNGKIGNYTETSASTAEDVYGKTKFLGELHYDHTLTIRSSFIGQELFDKTELLEWFLAQSGRQIKGFKNTLYSGVSTIFMSRLVKNIIINFPNLSGLYQLAPAQPISKFDLLTLANKSFNANVQIIPDELHVHQPTLNASKLFNATNISVPTWASMMDELAADSSFYQHQFNHN